MSHYKVVVIDDEQSNLDSLERILISDGAQVATFSKPLEGIAYIKNKGADVLITDLRMDGMGGLDVLEAVKTSEPSVEVILVTAYGTVEFAVEAMKKGAYDFITKPLQRMSVLKTVHRALEKRHLVQTNQSLVDELRTSRQSSKLLCQSKAMRDIQLIAEQAAQSLANVLIEGESGTGKGVLAEYIHERSPFAKGVLVKINCAAIPETLLEAELFGYESGAFTGAGKAKKGRVELADEGTLFLDEVGIAPMTIQGKLLRFVQEGDFERLGGTRTHHVRTRVISATNTLLKEAIVDKRFREDLYYRLNVVHIRMPSLRERTEDIPLLVTTFLDRAAKKNGRKKPEITQSALECLQCYEWPGNIRELENLVECLVVLNRSGIVRPEDLPRDINGLKQKKNVVIPIGVPLKEAEKVIMNETLRSAGGDKRLAAKLLGVHPRTIYRYLGSENKNEDEGR